MTVSSATPPPPTGKFSDWLRGLAAAVRPCRFSLVMVFLPAVALIAIDQGQEILRILGERQRSGFHLLFTVVATAWWAVQAWFWSRTNLSLPFPDSGETRIGWFAEWLPRGLGTSTFLAVAIALWRSAGPTDPTVRVTLRLMSFSFVLPAALFFFLTTFRRRIQVRLGRTLQHAPGGFVRRAAKALEATRLDVPVASVTRFSELPRAGRVFVIVSASLFLLFVLLFLVNPVGIAPQFSAVPILLFAAAGWITVGSWLVYLGTERRLPVLTALLAWSVTASFCNDNHAVRTLPRTPENSGVAVGFRKRLDQWRAARAAEDAASQRIPLFLVVAEGGGVRAAYWTASVLAALQDTYPAFARHIFASSGVSGGALGVAAFTGLVADDGSSNLRCRDGASVVPRGRLLRCADVFLAGDFLSPLLAAMLYPDFVQRYVPFLVPGFSARADRARALEVGWERGWRSVTGDSLFTESLSRLWSADSVTASVPALFLTGTSVETGKRIVTGAPFPLWFADTTEGVDPAVHPLALSSAVHMSARFTFFSPAGRLEHGHVVDGGYFDNSGAVTALDILRAVLDTLGPAPPNVRPVVIMIENELETDSLQIADWLGETLSPIRAMLHTRTARASLAKRLLQSEVTAAGGVYLRYSLECKRPAAQQHGLRLPLGWALSTTDRDSLQSRLFAPCVAGHDNVAARDSIGVLLRAPPETSPEERVVKPRARTAPAARTR